MRRALLLALGLALSCGSLAHARPRQTTPVNGMRFCRAAIKDLSSRTAAGQRTCVVFDLDNTLTDSRPRTLASFKALFRERGMNKTIPLHKVGWDGPETARNLGLGPASQYKKFWKDFFWRPHNLKYDAPIYKTISLAKKAKAAGAEVFYVTGRYQFQKRATLKQLKQLGLPDVDVGHLICKRARKKATGTYKRDWLKRIRRKFHVGWFMSDTMSDILGAQQVEGVQCVLVDFPIKPAGELQDDPRVKPGTPVIKVR